MKLENYIGNKGVGGLYQKIINQIPAHTRYRELFAGSGAIYANMTVPADDVILNDLDSEVQQLLQKRFSGITVTNECTISYLKSNVSLLAKETFIFLDPPYLHSTRSNPKLYKFEMTDKQHIEFLKACIAMKCNILIIHPKCELYDTMLADWRKVEISVRYHQKTQIETMYMNYGEVDQLQSYSYLGDNCWERQRIKRKGDRLVKKLQDLPVLEKKYILERLKEII